VNRRPSRCPRAVGLVRMGLRLQGATAFRLSPRRRGPVSLRDPPTGASRSENAADGHGPGSNGRPSAHHSATFDVARRCVVDRDVHLFVAAPPEEPVRTVRRYCVADPLKPASCLMSTWIFPGRSHCSCTEQTWCQVLKVRPRPQALHDSTTVEEGRNREPWRCGGACSAGALQVYTCGVLRIRASAAGAVETTPSRSAMADTAARNLESHFRP